VSSEAVAWLTRFCAKSPQSRYLHEWMLLARSPGVQAGCSADNQSGILGMQGVQKHSQGSKAASPFEKNGMESDYVVVVQENQRTKFSC
jgi:hypothetical protein